MEVERTLIGEALPGLQIFNMPKSHVAIDALVLIKAIDEDGDPEWMIRSTEGMSALEVIGGLRAMETRQIRIFDDSWQAGAE